jgi:hypothetical protein
VKLREKDFAHEQVVTGLKRKISELNKILIANGIPVPPNLFDVESPQATITLRMQDGVQNVKATLPNVNTAQRLPASFHRLCKQNVHHQNPELKLTHMLWMKPRSPSTLFLIWKDHA